MCKVWERVLPQFSKPFLQHPLDHKNETAHIFQVICDSVSCLLHRNDSEG